VSSKGVAKLCQIQAIPRISRSEQGCSYLHSVEVPHANGHIYFFSEHIALNVTGLPWNAAKHGGCKVLHSFLIAEGVQVPSYGCAFRSMMEQFATSAFATCTKPGLSIPWPSKSHKETRLVLD